MRVDDHEIIVTSGLTKIARIELEWDEDIKDPAKLIRELKNNKVKADIFTFCQRVPETEPKYKYYMEWDYAAILPVKSFDHWWEKQIDAKTRNITRKAQKKGVVVKVVDFDDELVKSIECIYNETPIRQGRPFGHYKKGFDNVKKENSTYLEKSKFIGAYHNDELIGYIRLINGERTERTVQIISKIEHRDKAPTNALIAKAVELCAQNKTPYLQYGVWYKGTLGDFKRNNGFEKMGFPRYYIPLTIKGKIALKLNLHHGIRHMIPENITLHLKDLRTKWHARKLKKVEKVLNHE